MPTSSTVQLPTVRLVEPTESDRYMIVARELMPAVEVLCSSSTVSPRASALIAAHTLECALKAFLAHKEIDSSSKPKKWHDLLYLWDTAHNQQLNIPPAPPDWVTVLGLGHGRPYYFRYQVAARTKKKVTIANGGQTPALIPMAVELKKIINMIELALKD